MKIEFREAIVADAKLLIEIYNSAFYKDFIRYGECPAYGRSIEEMQHSITEFPKFLILCDDKAIGCISCKEIETRIYEIGCLCVIPEFQRKGIGNTTIEFAKSHYKDWGKLTLKTPADKSENISFYTEKCGFKIIAFEMDGKVKIARFVLEKTERNINNG